MCIPTQIQLNTVKMVKIGPESAVHQRLAGRRHQHHRHRAAVVVAALVGRAGAVARRGGVPEPGPGWPPEEAAVLELDPGVEDDA